MSNEAYGRLSARFTRLGALDEAAGILHWDSSTMMPLGGGEARGEQLAALAGLRHELLTAEAVGADLAQAKAEGALHTRNLALMQRAYRRATALPTALVEAVERANASCEKVWRRAKAAADFSMVQPHLTEVVRLQREVAQALAAQLGLAPYDALMDGFQPGVLAADVTPVFDAYEAWLREALPRAEALQAQGAAPRALSGPFPIALQRELCREMAGVVGLDFAHARLDESLHPFCGGSPSDIRMTTAYDESNVAKALLGVLHETGHAMYERGLPSAFARQPVGEAAGMAVHESQSLIVEMQACRSDAFLGFLGTRLQALFGGDPAALSPQNLVRLWRRVERGFVRVDADEMTYPAHVIMRFRLERAMIEGDLAVADLPSAWREASANLLGIVPPNDALGCLQDIHWHSGAFGYFPSYTLGAMAAAQLMACIRRAVPDLDAHLRRGDMTPMMSWLAAQVHVQGASLGFQDLLLQATGKRLDTTDFTDHLTARYLVAQR